MDQLLERLNVIDADVRAHRAAAARARDEAVATLVRPHRPAAGGRHHHHQSASETTFEPQPILDGIQSELSGRFRSSVILWQVRRDELVGFGGELDAAVQMPGWTNVWTMPIQNRVDMLSTGVNTPIGIRVLGRNLEDVVRGADEVARVVKAVPGAVDVIADPIRGKPYIEVRLDRGRAARLGVRTADVNELIETAMAGRVVTWTEEGRERHAVVLRYPRALREDEESIRSLLVPAHGERHSPGTPAPRVRWVPLAEVADVRVVEGPATIKGENGLVRSYVRLSAQGRDSAAVVEDARAAIARGARLPFGVFAEFTGQFEHEHRARRTLLVVVPVVMALIFAILYWTYHDLADAALMMLAVPGAIAGGLFFQWLMGLKLSVTVWIGYIACFGMATSTGIIMLVYLREAVARAGGLQAMTRADLRRAVLDGAVHRLRPKLLTEGTVVLGLAPMLWSTGVASEVIRPMAAPVLGGILVADEVIDLLLPILFYWVRRRQWNRIHAAMPASPNESVDAGVQIAAGS
jgi:Cu(I)/Ag(I) efflux system membrane protein CusA/SilA